MSLPHANDVASGRAIAKREVGGGGVGRSRPHRAIPRSATARAVAASAMVLQRPPTAAMVAAAGRIAAVVNAGSESASANAFADSNRSAGSFSRAFISAAATLEGTLLRSSVTSWASSATIFMMICCAEPPLCGGSPASISYSTLASE